MRAAEAETLKAIDKACVESLGIPMMVLMENAALGLLKHVDFSGKNNYVIICGSGNNGGDGLALARHLLVRNHRVNVFFIGDEEKSSECCKTNYNILKKMDVEINPLNNCDDVKKLIKEGKEAEIIIDGIFGVGLNRTIDGIYAEVIDAVNSLNKYVVSIDIPSGLSCDSGKTMGKCIRAAKTITFEVYKKGFASYETREYLGEVIVEPIGIPHCLKEKFNDHIYITEQEYINKYLKPRDKMSHKGNFGRTLLVGGSKGYYGAILIATLAAVKSGSGLVTAAGSEEVVEVLRNRLTEAMTVDIKEKRFEKILLQCDGAGIGVGLGQSEESFKILKTVLNNLASPLVVDADALNIISKDLTLLKSNKSKLILTPHSGEMARLIGKTADFVNANRIDIAKSFAYENDVILLLKGYNTVITDGKRVFINPTGNSAMACGGMGDCLTGIIASFIAQGLEPFQAAICGAYIHGYCGEKLAKTMHSVTPSDVIDEIPFALKELLYN